MELLSQSPGPLIGLIGWAASALVILGATRLTIVQQRVMLMFTWLLWMIPAFDTLVYRGLLPADAAVVYCGGMTVALALIISLTAIRWRTRS